MTSVPDAVARARDAAHPTMEAAVERLNPELRRIAAYHLGWCDEHGAPSARAGGKGVRPALATLSAEAAGADADAGVPGAVAVELVHNFSLLHDDVIDGDRERRHRPTVWALYGIG
ncbi:MAG: polyprenyl synthetase family protein, partial [Acidimicrobiales bacterium]